MALPAVLLWCPRAYEAKHDLWPGASILYVLMWIMEILNCLLSLLLSYKLLFSSFTLFIVINDDIIIKYIH